MVCIVLLHVSSIRDSAGSAGWRGLLSLQGLARNRYALLTLASVVVYSLVDSDADPTAIIGDKQDVDRCRIQVTHIGRAFFRNVRCWMWSERNRVKSGQRGHTVAPSD